MNEQNQIDAADLTLKGQAFVTYLERTDGLTINDLDEHSPQIDAFDEDIYRPCAQHAQRETVIQTVDYVLAEVATDPQHPTEKEVQLAAVILGNSQLLAYRQYAEEVESE